MEEEFTKRKYFTKNNKSDIKKNAKLKILKNKIYEKFDEFIENVIHDIGNHYRGYKHFQTVNFEMLNDVMNNQDESVF